METEEHQAEEVKRYYNMQKELAKQIEAERKINLLLRKLLTAPARERLKNVRLVNQELYYKVVQSIIAAAQAGQISKPVDDELLKKLLLKFSEKRETRIIRK
ncbi:MAG: DNA-binding protein [Candidatus Diapherotrites archaeon]